MTLEALRLKVGDATFFRILRRWVAGRRYANGGTAGLIALAERLAATSLDSLFQRWLFEPGKPQHLGRGQQRVVEQSRQRVTPKPAPLLFQLRRLERPLR